MTTERLALVADAEGANVAGPESGPEGGAPGGSELQALGPSERVAFASYAHNNLQEMVKLADQKAATVIAAGGIIVAVLGSNMIDRLGSSLCLLAVGLLALALMVTAVCCAVGVLWSRFPKHIVAPAAHVGLLWATDIARFYSQPTSYVSRLLVLSGEGATADLAYENLKIAWILERKWAWQKRSVKSLLAAFMVWCVFIGLLVVAKEGTAHVEGK